MDNQRISANQNEGKKILVVTQHRSEYPNPITFPEGTLLEIGEKYIGDEGWDNWYFCTVTDQEPGWVPEQIIEWVNETSGRAKESYTAKELDVESGEILWGTKELNGWIWCIRPSTKDEGWVPLINTSPVGE